MALDLGADQCQCQEGDDKKKTRGEARQTDGRIGMKKREKTATETRKTKGSQTRSVHGQQGRLRASQSRALNANKS